jgi:putative tributyrin esterase
MPDFINDHESLKGEMKRSKRSSNNLNRALPALLSIALLISLIYFINPVRTAPQTPTPDSQQTLTALSSVQTSTKVGTDVTKYETLASASLNGAALPYRIWLPSDYAVSSKSYYPVLYLLHGLTGNEDDWWKRSNLAQYLAPYHLIVVTPGVGDSWYANSASDPHARYEDAIIRDLIPYIDAHYRTIPKREGRAIAGLSMGGLGAMKFALRYPQMFLFAASFSGAFDVPLTARLGKSPNAKMLRDLHRIFGNENGQTRRENDIFQLLEQTPPKGTAFPYLYVSVGKSDPLPQVALSNPRLNQALRAHNFKFEYYERPGTHDWHFWDSEVQFMLGRLCVLMRRLCS